MQLKTCCLTKRLCIKQFQKNIFFLILGFTLIWTQTAQAFEVTNLVSLASETIHKQNQLTQTDNRIDQKFNFNLELLSYQLKTQPYFGAHFIKTVAYDSIYNDAKSGLQLGLNLQLPYQIYFRAEERFQKQTSGTENLESQHNESRFGFYYFNTGHLPFAFENPKYDWDLYLESFYIPSLSDKSAASTGWARAQYWMTETGIKSNIYLELAAAENPNKNFGESYQEFRHGFKFQKQFSKASLQLQIYKNILANRAQDVRGLLAVYGEWQ